MEKDQILYAAEQLGVKPEVKEIIKKDYRKESTEIPEKDYEKLLSFLEADGVVEFSFVRHLCSSSSVIIRRWNCCGSWVRMIEAIRFFLEREEERISGGRCSLRFC
ncbi:MAG: hypothetical protein HY764_01150 [Candidatus Portnoybacteria bacterium]|nr:hypothetical protein [Candidatus Portnoybacteria bacterium]